jgi:hypothetical protein
MYHAEAGHLIDGQDMFMSALTKHAAAGSFVHLCSVLLCCAVLCWCVLTSPWLFPPASCTSPAPAATVLGCVCSSLGMAAAGQLVRLVLRGADSLSDFSAATLLGPYAWNKLAHLEIEGAQVRTASRL